MQQKELEELMMEHYQDIYSYCYRHVGERELAQDLTQMTFLRLWQNKERYSHCGKLLNYLYTIAGNLCRDWFKKRKDFPLEDLTQDRMESDRKDDSDTVLSVRSALARLSFQHRNIILLYYYHGFTAVEIAQITHTPLPTVRYRLHRAVRQLQLFLKEEGL